MGDYGGRAQSAVRAQIRAELGAKGLKQADLARMAGINTGTLSKCLNDTQDRDLPIPVVAEIAHAPGLTLAGLIDRADRRSAASDGVY